mgnify:CR=1 FL=1
MLIVTVNHLQDFKAFGVTDSKLNCKMLFHNFDFFFSKIWTFREKTQFGVISYMCRTVILYNLKPIYYYVWQPEYT